MKQKGRKITELLPLALLTVFALCILLVLLTGAGVYRNLVRGGEESYAQRTAVRYVTTRVRQAGAVTVEDFGGCEALALREEIQGEIYVTRVYCYDGSIRELFSSENARLSPEDGETVLEARSLGFSLEDGLLTVDIDGMQQLVLYVRAGREVLS